MDGIPQEDQESVRAPLSLPPQGRVQACFQGGTRSDWCCDESTLGDQIKCCVAVNHKFIFAFIFFWKILKVSFFTIRYRTGT